MKSIAIIPARGGSKRIPRKNIRSFLGQPIVNYSIKASLAAGCFDEVMVSTDDQEIAKLAMASGAQVPFMRSAENSGDKALTMSVLEEVVAQYHALGKDFDFVCCIYPTAPFITAEKLKTAHDLLVNSEADQVLPVVKFSYPIQRALKIKDHQALMFWPENLNAFSQDLEPAYHDCGQFYYFRTASMLAQRKIFADKILPLEIPELEVQDIDNEEDWQMAEIKYKKLNNL